MSISDVKGTGDAGFDDREFFEEDFPGLVPGRWTELPEGYDVPAAEYSDPRFTTFYQRAPEVDITSYDIQRPARSETLLKWAMRFEEADLGNMVPRDIRIEGVHGEFDFIGLVSRKQLDDEQTKETISDLQKNGVVTIVDGKSGISMDAEAYEMAAEHLRGGKEYAFDWRTASLMKGDPDWAHAAARGILHHLRSRRDIEDALYNIPRSDREKVIEEQAAIVRAAFIRRAA